MKNIALCGSKQPETVNNVRNPVNYLTTKAKFGQDGLRSSNGQVSEHSSFVTLVVTAEVLVQYFTKVFGFTVSSRKGNYLKKKKNLLKFISVKNYFKKIAENH